jgi:hypothetical protein
MTTIANTPAADHVNGTDLVWIWQNGRLLRTSVDELVFQYLTLIQLAPVAAETVLANVTVEIAKPKPVSISDVLDLLGTVRGSVLYRGASGWDVLLPGSDATVLTSGGTGVDPAWEALPAAPAAVTSVAMSGGTTGLTFDGPITSAGTITASGTLALASGGTGATTKTAAQAALSVADCTRQAVTTSGTSLSIDMSLGSDVALSLASTISVAFAITNWPASGTLGRVVLDISNTGAYNISAWPTGTIWQDGTAPTITSGNGKKDTILLTSSDGGASFRGFVVAQDMS